MAEDGERCESSFASTSNFLVDKERRSSAESKGRGKEQKEREALTAAECFNTLGVYRCEVQKNDTFELVGCFVKRLGAPALAPAVCIFGMSLNLT